jgi:hypothetical protein
VNSEDEKLRKALLVVDAEICSLRSVTIATIAALNAVHSNLGLKKALIEGVRLAIDDLPKDDPEGAEPLKAALMDIRERLEQIPERQTRRQKP